MKTAVIVYALLCSLGAGAQTKLADGTWQDLDLELGLRAEAIRESGVLRICVAKEGQCIENLTLGFMVRVYDKAGKEIWNSLWTGRTLDITFKKPLPEAHKVWVEATSPNVVNKRSGTRIATGKPLKLEFTVE
ncbi:MAG: hypothetical protein K9I86_05815 [Cryomorphaceae bacterium]|nr:hypothetical protein [Cryomorphaceae bacterium]